MKIKMILITVVVSGGIIGGVGYGAYYALTNRSTTVDVVPVTNVNQMYYDYEDGTMYGTVTSQVAQTVTLNDEYEIEKIYVEAGDTVKEGDPLLSYDMTLQELELEMEQLTLQTLELDKTRAEKELEKLRKTPATASLSANDGTMTAAGEDVIMIEEDPGTESTASGAEGGAQDLSGGSGDGNAEPGGLTLEGIEEVMDPGMEYSGFSQENGTSQENADNTEPESGESEPESVSEGTDSGSQDTDPEQEALETAINQYETLLLSLRQLLTEYEDSVRAAEIATSVKKAVSFYQEKLADEDTAADYQVKNTVRALLGEDKTAEIEAYIKEMATYQAVYIRLLASESHERLTAGGDSALNAEILTMIREAVSCYREWFAQEQDDGTYEMRNTVRALLGEEISGQLEVQYVELLIDELDMALADLQQKAEQARAEYEKLDESIQHSVGQDSLEKLEQVEELLSGETESESQSGTETESESQSGTETESQSGTETESQSGTETESESQSGTETESESQSETMTESESQSGTESESQSGTETESESQSGTMTESESQSGTETESSGETVPPTETESESESQSETTVEPVTETESEPDTLSPEDIRAYIEQFLTLASSVETDADYLTNLRTAINLFQQVLGELPPELAGTEQNTMQQYQLKQSLIDDPQYFTEGLDELYHSVCVKYVSGMIALVDPMALDPSSPETYEEARAVYEAALAAYEELGESWSYEITEAYVLEACRVILLIQSVDESLSEEAVVAAVIEARDAYTALSEEGKQLVWNYEALLSLMAKYGIEFETEEPLSETESEFWDDWGDGWGDWGDLDGEGYTAEELKELIAEKEEEIKAYELDIREQKLTVSQKQRVVDGKTVKSTMDGTVVSVGSEDGTSDDEYFLRVASTEGLYARGSMNELSLADIQVGDTISGMTDMGAYFTAVVKEIADYPDSNGSFNSYGSENSNASYYQFLALIDDPEGIEEGDAQLQLSVDTEEDSSGIYLEKYFVRTENDGRSYVMKQGGDGLLTKQYVTTGRTIYGYAIEILSGVTLEDKLAFPYGSDVVEGAKTREVDQLSYD